MSSTESDRSQEDSPSDIALEALFKSIEVPLVNVGSNNGYESVEAKSCISLTKRANVGLNNPPYTTSRSCSSERIVASPDTTADDQAFELKTEQESEINRDSQRHCRMAEEETCLICGDHASGFHYNALSCEGCKGFFRRSITRNAVYECKYGGNCEMDMWMRRRCQSCRLRRCREVGMKEDCLLSEDQCRARDMRRKKRSVTLNAQRKQRNSATGDSDSTASELTDSSSTSTLQDSENPLDKVSPEAREIIQKLVYYQDLYELPSADDVERVQQVKISDLGRPREVSETVYKHMAEMTLLVTQLVVEFAKKLPSFLELEREDQISLLKASSSEVMMLRSARRYDAPTDTIVFANGTPFTRETMRQAGLQTYADKMFEFCHNLSVMGVDNTEYALLMALSIFSERPGLLNAKQVEDIQSRYTSVLIEYLAARRPRGSQYLAKLLMKLTELRQLSTEHTDMLLALKVEKGSLPPLLCEYFDVFE